jgi:YD repeat-containing protein
MTSQLPTWIAILSALLTPTIAILVSVISWRQWNTAQLKFLLDLFDRRLKAIDAIHKPIGEVTRSGKVINQDYDADRELMIAIFDARFLFDNDVSEYLNSLREKLGRLRMYETMLRNDRRHDFGELLEKQSALFEEVLLFYSDFPKLCDRYVRMREKRPITVAEWLKNIFIKSPRGK